MLLNVMMGFVSVFVFGGGFGEVVLILGVKTFLGKIKFSFRRS